MFPAGAAAAARLLLPASVSVIYVIYKYIQSRRQTEVSVSEPAVEVPQTKPTTTTATTTTTTDDDQNDVVSRHHDGDHHSQQPGVDNPSDQFDPATVLYEIGNLDPAVLRDIRRKFGPAVIDDLRRLYLVNKGAEAEAEAVAVAEGSSSNNGRETEPENDQEKIGGGEESSRTRHKQQQREYPPGECWTYLKSGTCKNGPNCKYNHPSGGDEENSRTRHEEAPAGECWSYLKTGTCNIGPNCRFNHPVRRPRKNNKNKHYSGSGGCKHGKASSFNHSRGEPSVAPNLQLNFLGLPIRPGFKKCRTYMQNVYCPHGKNCKFNHPNPTAAGESDPPSGYGNGGPAPSQGASSQGAPPFVLPPFRGIPSQNTETDPPFQGIPTNVEKSDPQSRYDNGGAASLQGASSSAAAPRSAPRSLNGAPPYVPPPFQGSPSRYTEWNGYQAPEYLPERSMPAPPPYVVNKSVSETNVNGQYPQHKQVGSLEQPWKPVCIEFAITGDCKFKSSCKYDHRKNQTAASPSYAVSDKGLPLRPGENICPQYSHHGICNSGTACKFDHPSLPTFHL